jgi:hypothetical protein
MLFDPVREAGNIATGRQPVKPCALRSDAAKPLVSPGFGGAGKAGAKPYILLTHMEDRS